MKINITDKEKINNAIDAAQHRSNARNMNYDDIMMAAGKAEGKLAALEIPKRAWTGVTVRIEPEKVANSYRGTPEGTWVTLKRYPSGWFLIVCQRGRTGNCSHGSDKQYHLQLTDEAKSAIPDNIKM